MYYPSNYIKQRTSHQRSEKVLHNFFWALLVLTIISMGYILYVEDYKTGYYGHVVEDYPAYGTQENMTAFANAMGEGWQELY